jgi:ribulose-5-phosphate 4-epimerase/fuculose-1-phosphate aldolase
VSDEDDVLKELCAVASSLYDRGYAHGSTGNLSIRRNDVVWITPTGASLRGLTLDDLACVTMSGESLRQPQPSKEVPFHLAAYRARPQAQAVAHLHSLHAVALSCLADLNPDGAVPALTPYFFMRVAPLGVVPYFPPGSAELAEAIGTAIRTARSLLLRNHGLMTSGATLAEAVDAAEELEATARLFFLLKGERTRTLSPGEILDLKRRFPHGP